MYNIKISKDKTQDIIIGNNENNDSININLQTSQIIYNYIDITDKIYYEDMNEYKLYLLVAMRRYIFNNRYNLKNSDKIITSLRRLTGGIVISSNNINIIE